jgi:hypothetical protein
MEEKSPELPPFLKEGKGDSAYPLTCPPKSSFMKGGFHKGSW